MIQKKKKCLLLFAMLAMGILLVCAAPVKTAAKSITPGNTQKTAKKIAYDDIYTVKLNSSKKVYWFSFAKKAKKGYYTWLMSDSDTTPIFSGRLFHFSIYQGNTMIWSKSMGMDDDLFSVLLSGGKNYTMKCSLDSGVTGSFGMVFSYSEDPVSDYAENAKHIKKGKMNYYELEVEEDTDWFSFTAPSTKTYTFTLGKKSYLNWIAADIYDEKQRYVDHIALNLKRGSVSLKMAKNKTCKIRVYSLPYRRPLPGFTSYTLQVK